MIKIPDLKNICPSKKVIPNLISKVRTNTNSMVCIYEQFGVRTMEFLQLSSVTHWEGKGWLSSTSCFNDMCMICGPSVLHKVVGTKEANGADVDIKNAEAGDIIL